MKLAHDEISNTTCDTSASQPLLNSCPRDESLDSFQEDLPPLDACDPGNWDIVRMPVEALPQLTFRPSICRMTTDRDGEALLIATHDDRRVGIAFTWWLYQPGWVLVKDLGDINSNLLLEVDGQLLTLHQHTANLFGVLHAVKWQPQVLQLLERDNRLAQCMGDKVLPPPQPLSVRECECLRWTGAGKSPSEIAAILAISESTANKHLDAARRKLSCSTRTMAVLRAYRMGWL